MTRMALHISLQRVFFNAASFGPCRHLEFFYVSARCLSDHLAKAVARRKEYDPKFTFNGYLGAGRQSVGVKPATCLFMTIPLTTAQLPRLVADLKPESGHPHTVNQQPFQMSQSIARPQGPVRGRG